ncbi:hypothetical protein ACWD4O_46100 [Streptomyces sp. NPDC002623]
MTENDDYSGADPGITAEDAGAEEDTETNGDVPDDYEPGIGYDG